MCMWSRGGASNILDGGESREKILQMWEHDEVSRTRHYFAWFDDPIPFRAKVVINGLLRKLETMENTIDGESIDGEEVDSKLPKPTESGGIGIVERAEFPRSKIVVNQHPL
ncbi:hypothetical protein LINPERHAP1_LOCUS30708, partial [Linum perenne]